MEQIAPDQHSSIMPVIMPRSIPSSHIWWSLQSYQPHVALPLWHVVHGSPCTAAPVTLHTIPGLVQSSATTDTPAASVLQRTSSWGPFMVTYGTGQVAGTVAADTMTVGDITIKNQGFGLVLRASTDFLDISCDGLFVRFCPMHVPCAHTSGAQPARVIPFWKKFFFIAPVLLDPSAAYC